MQEIKRRRETVWIDVWARVPPVLRALALVALAAALFYVGLAYHRQRQVKRFRMIPGKAELSTRVERRVENFERRVSQGDRTTMYLRAALALSYDDGHHELQDVHLEYYGQNEQRPDKIDARQALYFSETEAVAFSGSVRIETRDQLTVNTEAVQYDVKHERAEVQVPLQFARENVSGRADAATVDGKSKKLELRGGVEITVVPGAGAGGGDAQASPRDRPVLIRAPRADYDHAHSRLAFSGGATAEQERDLMSGDTLAGFMSEQKRLQRIEARGRAYLRSMTEGRAAEVRSADMDFFFDAEQRLQHAVAAREVHARTLDAVSEAQLAAPASLQVFFGAQGGRSLLREMRAEGRSVLTLSAPRSRPDDPRAANKKLTADTVRLFWRATGRDLERAEAVGNAELVVEPVRQTPEADRKQLNAPRFDCHFYESNNLARQFDATGGAKAVLTPVLVNQARGTRTLTAQKMGAAFARDTQDVERVDASENAQFNEGDRNGQSAAMSYTAADATVRLRGGEPVVWDSRARVKADEIDSNTQTKVSHARGHAQTTYYSQEQTGGAAPFRKVKSPVFVAAASAEFQHETGVAVYTGEARAWQDDNFVRADRLTLRRETRRMDGEGRVQSALYQARRKDQSGNQAVVPVFATAQRMFYSDAERLLHYEGNVDIRQGAERITSEAADVYLQKELNEVDRTVAQRAVVLTQPGKRGTGEWAQYTASDETVMLTGNPARVEDAEQGTTEGRRVTVYLRENRAVADMQTRPGGQSNGRVRTTHKIRKQ